VLKDMFLVVYEAPDSQTPLNLLTLHKAKAYSSQGDGQPGFVVTPLHQVRVKGS
jgi:hypothetical protein